MQNAKEGSKDERGGEHKSVAPPGLDSDASEG